MEPYHWRFAHFGFPYSSVLDSCCDIWMLWIYAFFLLGFGVSFAEAFKKNPKLSSYFEKIMKGWKYQNFWKGIMLIYLKTLLFSAVNTIKFTSTNFMTDLSSVLATILLAALILYPVGYGFLAFYYWKMTREERAKSYIYNNVFFDEYSNRRFW